MTSITIPSTLTLFVGNNYTFSPTIAQSGATTTLTWLSSNTSVATVDAKGQVTAVGVGTSTITCTATNGVSAQCVVTVNPVLVESITLNETTADLLVGEKLPLQAIVLPENATNSELRWSSSDEKVAIVGQDGVVTAVASGICQITASATDGSGKVASCTVTVQKNNSLTIADVAECRGGRGTMQVILTDEEVVMGFQFDLQLPDGVSVPTDENGKLLASLTGNAANTHSISASRVNNGLYRFVVTPNGVRSISSENGDGMLITIDVDDEVAEGTYDLLIKDIEMTVRRSGNVLEDIHPKDNTAHLTVTEALMGDVNGDTRVTVTDVISIISYIQEDIPARFIRKVADMNGDGKVTITDAVQVIDIILQP